jgi:hypothetical protein
MDFPSKLDAWVNGSVRHGRRRVWAATAVPFTETEFASAVWDVGGRTNEGGRVGVYGMSLPPGSDFRLPQSCVTGEGATRSKFPTRGWMGVGRTPDSPGPPFFRINQKFSEKQRTRRSQEKYIQGRIRDNLVLSRGVGSTVQWKSLHGGFAFWPAWRLALCAFTYILASRCDISGRLCNLVARRTVTSSVFDTRKRSAQTLRTGENGSCIEGSSDTSFALL